VGTRQEAPRPSLFGTVASDNFAFLSVHDAQLVQLAAGRGLLPRRPCHLHLQAAPVAELLSKLIAARHAHYAKRETFEETLRRLAYERIIPRRKKRALGSCGSCEVSGHTASIFAVVTRISGRNSQRLPYLFRIRQQTSYKRPFSHNSPNAERCISPANGLMRRRDCLLI
jgi:hypothetical protein